MYVRVDVGATLWDFFPEGAILPLCEQVYKTYSGGVCDEEIALGHEEKFGQVLDVYEKILSSREVSNPTITEISSDSSYECECDMVNDSYLSCHGKMCSIRVFSFQVCHVCLYILSTLFVNIVYWHVFFVPWASIQ